MALTKVTSLVLQSNVISNTKIATAAIESRHISNSSILARHLGASANNAIVQSNVNTVQDNVTATEVRRVANVEALQANLNANVNIVQNNVADIINGIPFTGEVTISNQLGVGNTNPTPTSITLGEPANVTIDYGAQGGNVYIGMAGVSPFRLDVRGTANTGALTATGATVSGLTASKALQTNGSKALESSSVTTTELAYVAGVTSALQTQLDAKAALAGASFTGQVNMADDLVVTGNLVVNGDQTVANSINLVVQDRIIMVSNSTTGTPSQDAGIFVNRGNQGNAAIVYDESIKAFALYDTKDPHTNTAISPVTHSNLVIGTANVFGVANTGGLTSTGILVSGLTASRALQTDGSKNLESSSVTTTELGYVSGVTSAIQTQMDTKAADSAVLKKDGSVALTANWDAGSYEIRSATFESDIATGTAPFTIASTTAVTNLNADLLDGNHAAVFDTQSNAHDTFTKLNANLNVVSSNAAAALPKAGGTMTGAIAMSTNKITGLGDPTAAQDAATKAYVTSQLGTSLVPTFTTNTTSGTSNVFALTNSPADINKISVFIGGAAQTPTTDYIHVTGNNSIQFTDASVPASIQLVIHEWDTA